LMPVASEREAVGIAPAGADDVGSFRYVVSTLPDASGLEVVPARDRRPLGRLTLRGPANLGSIRPTGLAYEPGRGLLAVADRTGGGHLAAIRPKRLAGDRRVPSPAVPP